MIASNSVKPYGIELIGINKRQAFNIFWVRFYHWDQLLGPKVKLWMKEILLELFMTKRNFLIVLRGTHLQNKLSLENYNLLLSFVVFYMFCDFLSMLCREIYLFELFYVACNGSPGDLTCRNSSWQFHSSPFWSIRHSMKRPTRSMWYINTYNQCLGSFQHR